MGKGSSAPAAPDPSKVIPAQGTENRLTSDYNTYNNRVNTVTPTGTSTWSNNPTFDQAGYDAAMASYNAAVGRGEQVSAPDRAAYNRNNWTNTQAYTPEAQKLFDANQGIALDLAGQLPDFLQQNLGGWLDNLAGSMNSQYKPERVSFTGAPYLNTGDLAVRGRMSESDSPTMARLGNSYRLQAPNVRAINRGSLDGLTPGAMIRDWASAAPNIGQSQTRDWASAIAPGVMDRISKLDGLDPWQFDQEASDASYRMATRYMDPELETERKQLEARLGEQGFVPGTPAYANAMQTAMDSASRSRADARDRSILAGRQYGDQAFNNSRGAINDSIASLMGMGEFGLKNDDTRDDNRLAFGRYGLDAADLGLRSDTARSDEALGRAKFGRDTQSLDFDQQVKLTDIDRRAGLDANDVAKQQFDIDKGVAGFNNDAGQREFDNLTGLRKFNNDALTADQDAFGKVMDYNLRASTQNNEDTMATTKYNNEQTLLAQNAPIAQLLAGMGALGPLFGMMQPGGVPGSNIAGGGGSNPVDVAGIMNNAYNQNLGAHNSEVSSNNATMGAIASILAAFISDRRYKENITRIGSTPAGYGWYSFNYIGDSTPQQGVMAQEVPPEWTIDIGGVLHVDYSKVE